MTKLIEMKDLIKVEMVEPCKTKEKKVTWIFGETYEQFIKRMEIY